MNDSALNVFHEAKNFRNQFKSEDEMSAADVEQWEAMLDAVEVKRKAAQTAARYEELQKLAETPDESKRLPNPAVDAKDSPLLAQDFELKAFNAAIRGRMLTPEQKAALNVTTDNQGGYLTPVIYANELTKALTVGSTLRAAGARVISLPTVESVKFPTMTNTTRAVKTAEAVAFDEAEPTLGEITFTPVKWTRLVKASDEIVTDSRIDLMGQVIMPDVINAFILAENADFTTGDGSGDPQGIVTGGTLGKTTATNAAITADELVDFQHSLGYQYRRNAKFMFNDATIKVLRKLVTGVSGDKTYLWQPGLQANQPDTLLGAPVITNNDMATIATTAKVGIYADFSYFWIADFAGLEIRYLDQLYAASGQVGWRAAKRVDSRVMLAAAVQYLQMAV